jgi:hypothetical protein
MFVAGAPRYVIDLQHDEEKRWVEVIAHEKVAALRLVQEAAAEFSRVPELLRWVFTRLYNASGGLYQREIASWAEGLDVSVGTATMLNCAYELSHLRWPKLFGCTAGMRWFEGLGMVHIRSLDWPLRGMGGATRVFRFRRGAREFITIGVPGQVGVLSGMLPHAYSITINWAPPTAFPTFDFGPTFLVRDTLENCDSYVAAVRTLEQTRLSTSVFFTVCGTEKDQACVIERTQREAAVRQMAGGVLVQTNHHVAARFASNNRELDDVEEGEEEFSLEGSSRRANSLAGALTEVNHPCTVEGAAITLNIPHVLNKDTCQQMVFCPASGAIEVWRATDD